MEHKELIAVLERIAVSLEDISTKLSLLSESKEEGNEQGFPSNGTNLALVSQEDRVNGIDEIERFLNSRGIKIKYLPQEDDADEILDRIALFMGSRYTSIKRVYELIKKNLSVERPFRLDLKSTAQEDIANITQLCTQLHQIAFLEEYRYLKSPRYELYAKVNRIPSAINFFSGGWLERYIKAAIIESLNSLKVPVQFTYIKNPQISLPNGDDFELDILFKINSEFFWLEAKTGDYQRYIQKYSSIRKMLRLDEEHSFMIFTDVTDDTAMSLRNLYGMNVVRVDYFRDVFKEHVSYLNPVFSSDSNGQVGSL